VILADLFGSLPAGGWLLVILAPVLLGAGYLICLFVVHLRQQGARARIERMEAQAQEEVEQARKKAETQAREELYGLREEFERETRDARSEARQQERRLAKREDQLDRKTDLLSRKERYIENLERELSDRQKTVTQRESELKRLIDDEMSRLHQISGLNKEEATGMLLKRLEQEVEHEAAEIVARSVARAKEDAEQQAREILAIAIQRCAVEHTADSVVSTVDLPSDDMKGRIIGREGRNIRAFEKATGVDVIVDDTPGVVVVSGFDSIRRETARRAMEKLVQDGRIHPARIEEVVEKAKGELDSTIQEAGKQAALDTDVRGLHPREIEHLGRLRYRTSYGQNVLNHSIDVAHLCGIMAAELGLNIQRAKRIGLLHDIGKAVDQEMEGGHPEIGADVARRCEEPPEVVNAIAAHHEGTDPKSLYAILVQAADAVSASRPGARRETLEKYIKRLEKLEELANAFPGVETAYAIQAGREIRVIIRPDRVEENAMTKMGRDIAKEIEHELSFPGEIRVTLIRESRVVEYAR